MGPGSLVGLHRGNFTGTLIQVDLRLISCQGCHMSDVASLMSFPKDPGIETDGLSGLHHAAHDHPVGEIQDNPDQGQTTHIKKR
jgi:hypothetical protein